MGDRETLVKISKIMRRLLLLPYGACGEIAPRKGTTRRECYRALWEIQELLQTRKLFFSLSPQTNADRIHAMTDEELAKWLDDISKACYYEGYTKETDEPQMSPYPTSPAKWVKWLKQEAT